MDDAAGTLAVVATAAAAAGGEIAVADPQSRLLVCEGIMIRQPMVRGEIVHPA